MSVLFRERPIFSAIESHILCLFGGTTVLCRYKNDLKFIVLIENQPYLVHLLFDTRNCNCIVVPMINFIAFGDGSICRSQKPVSLPFFQVRKITAQTSCLKQQHTSCVQEFKFKSWKIHTSLSPNAIDLWVAFLRFYVCFFFQQSYFNHNNHKHKHPFFYIGAMK